MLPCFAESVKLMWDFTPQEMLEVALEEVPQLTPFGLRGSPYGPSKPFSKKHYPEIAVCAEWLQLQTPMQRINKRHTSYSYKHMVERWAQSFGFSHRHIHNGSFIVAALASDFRRAEMGSRHNLYLNLSEKGLKATRGFYSVELTDLAPPSVLSVQWG